MGLQFGKLASLKSSGPFVARDEFSIVQFSGGRTSATLAALSDERCQLFFENTGKEHEKTLEFVQAMSEAIGRKVTWLEFRPPARRGAPPKEFGFAIVDFKTAARKGEPFAEMMRCMAEYRATKRKPPVAPWAKSRICTTHLKHRVLDHYLTSIGVHGHERMLGLRADEPDRVARLPAQETRVKTLRAPLTEAGITKVDVLEFWSDKDFDLGLEEHEGNCDGCFLKDQADRSRAIGNDPETTMYWQSLQDTYPRFGGRDCVSYTQLAKELPARLLVERILSRGEKPNLEYISALTGAPASPRRLQLVIEQERKRFIHGTQKFSCACESSMGGDEEEDGESDEY